MMSYLRKIGSFDTRSLTAFRIALALLVLYDLAARFPDLNTFYSDEGILPLSVFFDTPLHWNRWSLYYLNGSSAFTLFLFAVTALCSVVILLGKYVRVATFFTWLLIMSLHVRNPLVNAGGDMSLRLILFWSIFLPWGASPPDAKPSGTHERESSVFGSGNLFYGFQISFMYWCPAFHKAMDSVWRQGEGIWASLSNANAATGINSIFLSYPSVLPFLNYAVIALEFVIPLLLWIPYRVQASRGISIFILVLLHLGIASCLRVGFFPVVSIVAILPWIPTPVWDQLKVKSHSQLLVATQEHLRNSGLRNITTKVLCGVGIVAVIFTTWWNLEKLDFQTEMPSLLKKAGKIIYLDQYWTMFVSPPGEFSLWYEMPGRLQGGAREELSPFPEPTVRPRHFRWERYLRVLWKKENRILFQPVLSYLCREWNTSHSGSESLEQISVSGVYQVFYPKQRDAKRFGITNYQCP